MHLIPKEVSEILNIGVAPLFIFRIGVEIVKRDKMVSCVGLVVCIGLATSIAL